MADQSSEDWLPAGWTVSVRVRRNGKKDKHYFAPDGLKFYSKVEVTRYLKTVSCSPSLLKEGSSKDASANAVRDGPDPQEMGKLGLELSSQNGSPESEEKYYSAEETPADDCGNSTQSGSLNSEDKKNPKPEQPAENCFGEDNGQAVKECAQDISGSSMEEAKSNLKQPKEKSNSPRSMVVKIVKDDKSAYQIGYNATENESHQFKEEENIIFEEKGRDACDHVKQDTSPSSKEKKKTRLKKSANVVVERCVAEGLPDGWIKEIKVKKKSNAVRRDPYYIDPVTGYIFRSMKDALRYLATGDIGRLAFKRKDKGDSDTELEDAKNPSPLATKDLRSDENGTNTEDPRSKQIEQQNLDESGGSTKNQSSTQSAEETDGQVCGSANMGKAMPDTKDSSDQSASVTDLSGSDPPNRRDSGRNKGRKNSNGTNSTPANEVGVTRDVQLLQRIEEMPACAQKALIHGDEMRSGKMEDTLAPAESAGFPQDDQPPEHKEKTPGSADKTGFPRAEQPPGKEATPVPADGAGIPQGEQSSQKTEDMSEDKTTPQGTPKSRKRKFLDFPRRTSSRLAGVSVDPSLEVTRTRAQRAAIRRLDEGEACGVKSVITTDSSEQLPQTRRTRRGNKLLDSMTSLGPSEAVFEEDADKPESDQAEAVTTRDYCQLQPQAKRTRRGNELPDSVTSEGMLEAVLPVDMEKPERHQAEGITTRNCSQQQSQTKFSRRGNRLSDPITIAGTPEADFEEDTDKLARCRAEAVTTSDCSQQQLQCKRTRRGNRLPDTMTCVSMSQADLEEDVDKSGRHRAKAVATRDCCQQQPQTKRTRKGNSMTSVGPSEAALEEDAHKPDRDRADDKKKGKSTLLLPEENIIVANHAEKPNPDYESEDKPLLPFELPSGDILSDPCIEFAIKTLTGIDFDTCKSTPKSSNDSNASRDAITLKVPSEHMEIEREVNKQQAAPDKSISKAYNCVEKAGSEIPSSSLSNLPLGDSWQDPCIEFAIKTLTGAIPVEYDLDIPDLMRQQLRSSQIQESSEVALSNVEVDNFCRTDLLWQHSGDASSEKTAYRQHRGVIPTAQQPGNNVDLQRTGGAVLRQHHQGRGSKYQR